MAGNEEHCQGLRCMSKTSLIGIHHTRVFNQRSDEAKNQKSGSHCCVAQKQDWAILAAMWLGVSGCLNGATAFWENCLHTVTCKNSWAQ